jgi:hypothetical protein
MNVSRDFPGAERIPWTPSNRRLFAAAIRLNVTISAIGMGAGSALALFLGTHLSLAITGNHAGRYLNLLSVFMPGYSADPSGAWFGLMWGVIYGGVSGGLLAWLYARTLGPRILELVAFDRDAVRDLRPPILLISGGALGIALGSIMALQLILTTTWLVLRGTADKSTHAQLLSNYLPGYSVTVQGSLLGALQLFIFVYIISLILGRIYNWVVYILRK